LCTLETVKNILLVYLAIIISFSAAAQKGAFRSLTPPEKRWTLTHPFIARTCYRVAKNAQHLTDSLVKAGQLDTLANGSNQDAFRHCCWMALLVQEISAKRARHLGNIHEAGNEWTYRHRKTEEGVLPDSMATVMDLANNETGIAIGLALRKNTNGKASAKEIAAVVSDAVFSGKCVQLRRDSAGNFVRCDGRALQEETWKGKWNIPKCLEPSTGVKR
jgi:hypothetical protein